MKILTLVLLTALAGCQTCEQHPVVCSVAVGVVVTSIALSARHSSHSSQADQSHDVQTPSVKCGNGACL